MDKKTAVRTREKWVDDVKVIACILVVLGHFFASVQSYASGGVLYEWLIDVFASLHKECNDAVLLLFGDGELRESMQQKVKKLHLEESVHFMGTTNEMQKMYQAMDVFVMPSFCEGLPVAGVEAQASGLPVLLADTITKEVDVTDCVKYLPLSKDKSAWVKEIQSFRDFKRYSRIEELRKAGFDEKDVAKYFQNFYLNILDKL